jgi:putative flippase GtrA
MSIDPEPLAKADAMGILSEAYERHHNLVKYVLIGASASAIDVALFMILHMGFGTTPLFAHSISVPTAVLFSFVVNARHNFRVSDHLALRLLSFVAVCVVGYVAGYGVIVAAVWAGASATVGKILSLPVVFAVQYILNSRITFRGSSGRAAVQQER